MDTIKKKKLINEYVEGEEVKDIFVVKIKKGISDYSRGFYFALILTDSSGKSIDYRYWGGADEEYVREIYNSIGDDSVIYLEGKFSFYNGKPQIVSNDRNDVRVLEEGQYKREDFIKRSKKDLNFLMKKFENYIIKIQNPEIKRLLEKIFDEEFKEKYKLHPGAISIHHNWIGGLMEHTLEILRYCEITKEMFPDLSEDLMIAGALLHDIGKLEEMEMPTRIKGPQQLGQIWFQKRWMN